MKKICRLAMVLGTVAVFGFLGCTALTGNNKSGTTQSGTEGNTGGNENGNNTGENNQTQTVDLSTALSSFTEDEITALEESINTQILSSTNGVTGITATIDADKNLSLTYGGNASVAITPVLTDDGAIKLLETYANKSTVIAAKKTELKNTADNFAIPNELAQKLEGNAVELKASIKTVIENIPTEKFAYDLGSRAIYLKMSDLDSPILPEATEDGATVIPGVKRIMKNGRTALDFTELANADIKLDFEGKNKSMTMYYRGGFIFGDKANVTLDGDEGIFAYTVNKEDFADVKNTDRSILNVLQKTTKFSKLRLTLSDNNIYGLDLDKIYENNKNNIEFFGSEQELELKYDAKEALNGESMFSNTDKDYYNSNANTIDVNFAQYLLRKGVSVKNVIVTGSLIGDYIYYDSEHPDGYISKYPGTLANAVVSSDMSRLEELNVKGIVRFNGKTPKQLSGNKFTKTIHTQDEDADNLKISSVAIDVSRLSIEAQDIINSTKFSKVYYKGTPDQIENYSNSSEKISVYFETTGASGKKSYKGLNYDYTNEAREKYGNTGEEPKDPDDINERDDKTGPQARANNIKLTPIQKLLLDDQHIYG